MITHDSRSRARPVGLRPIDVDVRERRAVEAFLARTEAAFAPPAVVVTAAGVQATGPSESFAHDDWQHTLDVNLTGTWNLIQGSSTAAG